MRILVTGFEPFGNDNFNASDAVVSALPDHLGKNQITTAILPVSFTRSGQALNELLAETQPDALLCLGEAGGRKLITPELRAVNLNHARIPDNDGAQPQHTPIVAGGPHLLHPGLDARRITRSLVLAGFAAAPSEDAGRFVCNHVAYLAYAQPIPALFIHVPALRPDGSAATVGRETDAKTAATHQEAADWDLPQLASAIERVLAEI
ncbi:pyroglutamyl-peptidase I [Glutamicibacter sp. NPDC087344]|uniref:pyroglutamyl-peptidase I family protein n=1 Tax=Glutamicibacter sp. NPDC087344 TaxID=3363994 RepID=UPI00381D66FA